MAHAAYNWQHQKIRERLLKTHVGLPCPRCGKTMILDPSVAGGGLDLGHTDPADKLAGRPGDRLEHANCNRSFGDGSRRVAEPEWTSVSW